MNRSDSATVERIQFRLLSTFVISELHQIYLDNLSTNSVFHMRLAHLVIFHCFRLSCFILIASCLIALLISFQLILFSNKFNAVNFIACKGLSNRHPVWYSVKVNKLEDFVLQCEPNYSQVILISQNLYATLERYRT